ncbi:LOW QUALITY PROTEIN: nuclear RNA export factor 2-like [Rhynchonycteris naso]
MGTTASAHRVISYAAPTVPGRNHSYQHGAYDLQPSYFQKDDRNVVMRGAQKYQFHYVENRALFFIQDASSDSALKKINYKIYNEENRKILIFVTTSAAPYSVRYKLEPEKLRNLKLIMKKRYDVSQKSLDLQLLRYDQDTSDKSNSRAKLVDHDVDIIRNQRNCMAVTLKIIEKNFPELLSLNLCKNRLYQLDGLSDMQIAPIKILNLSNNEKCCNPNDQPLLSVFGFEQCHQEMFPELLRLKSYKGSDYLKSHVLQFLQQYYLVYDSGDRQRLLDAYHDEACFSLTIPFNSDDTAPSSLFDYLKDNRNMKNIKDPNLCFQLLKHTKRDIVCSLCRLPKTQHDTNSFVVDMWFSSGNLLCFSIYGVFKEVEGKSQGPVRAFTRTFIVNLASNSGMFIVNDELFVKDVTCTETQSALSTQVSTPSCSSVPTLSQEQQDMAQVSISLSQLSL